MLLHMRTTVELPDDLFRRAKAKAAREGRTLTSLFEEALRKDLDQASQPRRRVTLRTFHGDGVQPGVDLSNNAALRDLMDEHDRAVP